MIKLVKFAPLWGLPSASPFCVKLETYLRMCKLPYESKISANTRLAPFGKLPYIVDRGKKIADSRLIIDYLKRTYGDILDNNLSNQQKAQGHALQRMLEEHFYWLLVYSRWMKSEGWQIAEPSFFKGVPQPLRKLIGSIIRHKVERSLYAQGLGRFSSEQVYELGKRDIFAVAHTLEDKFFILGDQPTSFDASCYAMLVCLFAFPYDNPVKTYATQFPNIQRYVKRMRERYYSGI